MFGDPQLARYLERYAEPEARAFADWVNDAEGARQLRQRPFERAVVVPLLRESAHCLQHWAPAFEAAPGCLLIAVVNANDQATAADLVANQRLLGELLAQAHDVQQVPGAVPIWLVRAQGMNLLLIDRSQPPHALPAKEGVGLARKLGCDLALVLLHAGLLRDVWLYQTDADTRWPRGTLLTPLGEGEGARVLAFRHGADPTSPSDTAVLLHTLQYEAWLRYHVLNLACAGSPYAFHALGSCLVVHARSYIQVRGFPKRAAGEDYYLLQKLAKVAPVLHLAQPPLHINARVSDRAPFGTGKAVGQLSSGGPLLFDAPASYQAVGSWLAQLARFAQTRSLDDCLPAGNNVEAQFLRRQLQAIGTEIRFKALLNETSSSADLLRRAQGWFDGLKTLQLLHALRSLYPQQTAQQALQAAPFAADLPVLNVAEQRIEVWQQVCESLAALEPATLARVGLFAAAGGRG